MKMSPDTKKVYKLPKSNRMKEKKNLDKCSPIEIFEMILSKQIKRFPPNFWKNDFSLDYAEELGKYVIEKFLNNDDVLILENYGNGFINKVHLHSALKLFNGCAFEYIDFLYPNRFKAWQFKSCPNAYWNSQTAIEATKWLIEECLKWDDYDVKTKVDSNIFNLYKLNGMLSTVYNDSVFSAINTAYPNRYHPWELNHVPLNYWKKEQNVKDALKWLIEEKLDLCEKEIPDKISIELLTQNGLSGILRWYNPYDILEKLYSDISWDGIKNLKKVRKRLLAVECW